MGVCERMLHSTSASDRIVLVMACLGALALLGATAGTYEASFFDIVIGIIKCIFGDCGKAIGDIIGGKYGDIIGKLIGEFL